MLGGVGPVELLIIVFFGLVGLLVLSGLVLVPVLVLRNARAARRAGYDPTTMHTDVLARLAQGSAVPLEQRLRELDDLRSRGVITPDEHATARASLLSGR